MSRGAGRCGSTPSVLTKRFRVPSDEQEGYENEIDPELLLDSLVACLT